MLNHTPTVFILVISGMLASSWIWMKLIPLARTLGDSGSGRFRTIDGMRGLAAASVFAGHTATSMDYARTGRWVYGDYAVYLWATEGAVAIFFMITGFLFWDKALKSGINLRSHLLSRVRRIYPLYILSSLFIFSLVVLYSEFALKVPVSSLLITFATWATGGLFKVDEINRQGLLFLNANVLWTLQYEWIFYLLLPLLVLLFRYRTSLMAALYVAIVLAAVFFHMDTARSSLLVGLPLLCGCITAAWLRSGRYVPAMNSPGSSATAFCLLVLSITGFRSGFATLDIILLMWPLFSMIVAGCNPAGFLTWESTTFLGKISYGVYMMHGIMLCFIQRQWAGFEANYPIAFLAFFLVAIFLFTGWCQWVFRNIEEPYITHALRIGTKEYSVP